MKSRITVFALMNFLILMIQSSLIAQPGKSSDYLLLHSGDTLYGTVDHVDYNKVTPTFYKKIRLVDTSGKKKKFKYEDVAAFQSNGVRYEGFLLNQSQDKIMLVNPRYDIMQNGELHFLKVVSKGALSHYELEWIEQGEQGISSMDLLKKADDGFFIRATQGLLGLKRKVLIDYFQDCPDLQEQIQEKQLKEVWQLTNFYNSHCLN